MPFAAETYREAAEDRIALAARLYEDGAHGFALYTAGLAVECILRAYRTRIDPEFDSRHRLDDLARQSGFADRVGANRAVEIGRSLTVVVAVWRNEHRFRSDKPVRAFLVRRRLYHGIKGDVLKEHARRVVNEATFIVNHGVSRWRR